MDSFRSNQELIEDITKDLENSSLETENGNTTVSSEDNEKSTQSVRKEYHEDIELIDEASLLDRDSILSDKEKEDLKEEAIASKMKGNIEFKNGEYCESIISYSKALKICPLIYTNDRSILFANRAASKHKLSRKESAIEDCSKAIELNSYYLKAYLRRAALYEETEKLEEALEDYKKILELDARNKEAISGVNRLPRQIEERNEKLKAEMIDKLKDLGNMVLRPFGLSTNNFKMTKDPNSGGYSINFVQNQ